MRHRLRDILCVVPAMTLTSCLSARGPGAVGARVDAAGNSVGERVSQPTIVARPAPEALPVSVVRADNARIGPLIRAEDVAAAVASVFGDTSALHPSQALLDSSEPVRDMDVRTYEARERVMYYVQYFSTEARERFQERLTRGSRYQPMILSKLRASGMPADLTYLAMIESGYDPDAYSRSAAVGMWQFMTRTARDVGMRVDWWVDERRDPARSTDGAIRFLGELQQQFGSLYLAAAAYNGGPGKVARGLTQYATELEGSSGEDRFFALAERNYLRTETKDYVPRLIAAALIGNQPSRYDMAVDSQPEFAYDSVFVGPGTTLAAVAQAGGGPDAAIRELNPSVLRGMAPPDGGLWVRVLPGRGDSTQTALHALPDAVRLGFRMITVPGSRSTKATVASAYGISTRHLAWFNPGLNVGTKGRLVAGQRVRIPTPSTIAFARDVPDPSIERYGPTPRRRVRRASTIASDVRRKVVVGASTKSATLTKSRAKNPPALNSLASTNAKTRAKTKAMAKTSGKSAPAKKAAPKSSKKKR